MRESAAARGGAALLDERADGAAVAVDGLVKTYGSRRAVDGISFRVARGETFALLGPNGAGKTTTLEILEGYRAPDAGTVRVLGLDPQRQGAALRARIGVMLQETGLYRAITPREALHLFASYYTAPADPDALLALVGLEDAARTRYRRLSGGQRQRLALALALVGRPELLFLDEPSAGMDPQARAATWDLIRQLKTAGTTVLLTTHYLEEAARLADRVAIVDHGQLIALGTPAELTRGDATQVRLRAAPGLDVRALAALPSVMEARETQPGVYALQTRAASDLLVELAAWLRERDVLPSEVRVGEESLEDVFLRLTGRELR
ncbi:MAG TPA: ABC transporter ATP-binding protein [Chloroflexota bacterium]|nr:ABC transporter ATP-binding protein [Chloroflexota bacterium]